LATTSVEESDSKAGASACQFTRYANNVKQNRRHFAVSLSAILLETVLIFFFFSFVHRLNISE
jgi:hypothetical protein